LESQTTLNRAQLDTHTQSKETRGKAVFRLRRWGKAAGQHVVRRTGMSRGKAPMPTPAMTPLSTLYSLSSLPATHTIPSHHTPFNSFSIEQYVRKFQKKKSRSRVGDAG